ncbi:hypothetical protein BCR32DRAFT_308098 [Anaeromyces robustus]|uniref:C2CD3 N-terminal C2 domain-containing protein n=1 Tax=Anaeromyces robustus TaxID=1754192 RepID=A0A1Y1XQ17_9FUNG|nr:hypothetical protein BCR32DRAFT_308098 [Anaeromyces robustus]|eukprot:ORX87606.1 hypothetical protein BCR32DRAFT_308098 [Anaeromyces robustus]
MSRNINKISSKIHGSSTSKNKTIKYDERYSTTDISIPPKVKGITYYFLTVNINTLIWKDINYKKKYTSYGITTSRSTVKVRLQWWGDDTGSGSIFYPYIAGPNSTKSKFKNENNSIYENSIKRKKINNIPNRKNKNFYKVTSATYPICCDIHELNLYFTDMKNIILDIIVDGSIMGKSIIEDLANITETLKPIHKTYPVYLVSPKGNIKQSIIAELDVEFILQKNKFNNRMEKMMTLSSTQKSENTTEEIKDLNSIITEEIQSDTEIPVKETKEYLKNSVPINNTEKSSNNSKDNKSNSITENEDNNNNQKNGNEESQFILDNILTNECTANIMNTKEPLNSIKDYSEYSIENIKEEKKGFIII